MEEREGKGEKGHRWKNGRRGGGGRNEEDEGGGGRGGETLPWKIGRTGSHVLRVPFFGHFLSGRV